MSEEFKIAIRKEENLKQFLIVSGFEVEDLGEDNFRVQREKELPVYINITNRILRFQVEICKVSSIDNKESFFKFLDLNTEILPVAFGIDTTIKENPSLVLVESRQMNDLNDSALLGVFDALELALDRAESELVKIINKGV